MTHFSFALIVPVAQGLYPDTSTIAYYKRVTKKPLTLLDGSAVTYSYKFLPKRNPLYNSSGPDTLMPNTRADKDISRSLNAEDVFSNI